VQTGVYAVQSSQLLKSARSIDQLDNNDSTGTGHPSGFNYGAEYTEAEINAGNVSEKDTDGHGTHVTGTAASSGNELVLDGTQSTPEHRGMAPKADIVAVKAGNESFSNANVIDALSYCDQVGSNEGKPVVANMSLGGHNAPHDGTSTLAQTVDQFTNDGSATGRVAVVSAGNEGGQPIHTSSSVGSGNTSSEPWTVGSYSATSGTQNDYFFTTSWINGSNDLQITVTSPNGESLSLSATGSSTTTNSTDTPDGAIYIESGIGSSNGDRYFEVWVFDNTASQPPAQGTWTIDVTNNGSSSTTYHGWTYDHTVPGSFDNGNGQYSIGSPGTAASAITVGSYVHRWRWTDKDDNSYAYDGSSDNRDDISTFSSRGPLRDGSQKPDIAAPGQGMISALSLDKSNPRSSRIMPGGKHRMIKGTSMSAPVVAGSAALLLQEDATLTSSDIESYFTNNATVDDFVTTYGSTPNSTFGAGKLDVLGAMVDLLGGSHQREILSYEDSWTFSSDGNQTVGGNGANKIALRFTPSQDGFVTGTLFNLGSAPAHNLSSPLNVEVWSDDGSGNPDSKLGSTVQLAPSQFKDYSPNAVNLIPSSVQVNSGTDYHLVLYPSTSSEEIDIAYETAGSASGRSQTFDGSSWSGLGADFIIRPEIARTSGVSGQLPVEIAAFSGITRGSDVTLTWSTASEKNNAGFRLQHKPVEASSFSRVAFVEGNGTTNEVRSYRYTLDDLAPGAHTFKLKQVDTDETVHSGPKTTISVSMQEPYSVTPVSPNPVSDRGTFNVTVREEQDVQVSLYNALGQRVAVLHDGPLPAQDRTQFQVGSTLQSGFYFLRVDGESFSTSQKFVRVR
jgi:subtilisin family serine protease